MLRTRKVPTVAALGEELDRAVAECEGIVTFPYIFQDGWKRFEPHRNQHMADPIIKRAGITLSYDEVGPIGLRHIAIRRHRPRGRTVARGPSHLVAALRCLVASEIGDTIVVPLVPHPPMAVTGHLEAAWPHAA